MKVDIVSFIRIKDNRIWINNIEVELDIIDGKFMKSIYKYLKLKHPKFYKMDELSKLGFISTELLLSNENSKKCIAKNDPNKVGVVLQNSDSTVDVDSSFYNSIADKNNYHPSPSLFVYTLPNIPIGEICIYNKFRGENALFISEEYNVDLGVNYINSLLDSNKLDTCIGGWINANDKKYEAFLYLVTKVSSNQEIHNHTKDNILKKYK